MGGTVRDTCAGCRNPWRRSRSGFACASHARITLRLLLHHHHQPPGARQAHNLKVAGSNPAPATKSPSISTTYQTVAASPGRGGRVYVRALSGSAMIVRFWPTLAPFAKRHPRICPIASEGHRHRMGSTSPMSVNREFEMPRSSASLPRRDILFPARRRRPEPRGMRAFAVIYPNHACRAARPFSGRLPSLFGGFL